MARCTDDFLCTDAANLLRPIHDPTAITVTWGDDTQSTFRVSISFTDTPFHGRRAWFLCPRCRKRCRKLYSDPMYRIMACRLCLRLRYRSQQLLPKGVRSFLEAMGEDPNKLGFRRENG